MLPAASSATPGISLLPRTRGPIPERKRKLPTRLACGNAPTGSGARLLSNDLLMLSFARARAWREWLVRPGAEPSIVELIPVRACQACSRDRALRLLESRLRQRHRPPATSCLRLRVGHLVSRIDCSPTRP